MDPDAINADGLPRALRGYDCEATDDLLKRVAWDYLQVLGEVRRLSRLSEQDGTGSGPTARVADGAAGGVEPDEVGRALIAAAQKAAKELRESTRRDCEAAIKKARKRAQDIAAAEERKATGTSSDVAAVLEAAARLRGQLSAALEAVTSGSPEPETDVSTGLLVSAQPRES
jgi:cell division septum initiation protein DivIVA